MAAASKILIVEDEGVLGENIAEYFRTLGYEVTLCWSAAEALEALRCFAAEIVVLDLDLPGGGGDRVMAELSRLGISSQRWVLITSRSVEDRSGAPGEMAGRLLSKPFALHSLGSALGGILLGGRAMPGERP